MLRGKLEYLRVFIAEGLLGKRFPALCRGRCALWNPLRPQMWSKPQPEGLWWLCRLLVWRFQPLWTGWRGRRGAWVASLPPALDENALWTHPLMSSGRAEGGIFVVGCTDPKWEPSLNDPVQWMRCARCKVITAPWINPSLPRDSRDRFSCSGGLDFREMQILKLNFESWSRLKLRAK